MPTADRYLFQLSSDLSSSFDLVDKDGTFHSPSNPAQLGRYLGTKYNQPNGIHDVRDQPDHKLPSVGR